MALLAVCLGAAAYATPPPQRGIALGLFDSDENFDYGFFLDEIAAQGASHVSLVTVWYQKDIEAEELRPRPGYTVSDGALARTIEQARQRGLRVLLFPIIGVEIRKANEWRGRIKPKSWDAWHASYHRYILHIAAIAERTGVETLSVGSELLSTERTREPWARLIADTRKVYRGKILYSANWDHYEPVSFWDLVDVMGVTSYYELSKEREPALPTLIASWERWKRPLVSFAKRIGKPLVFTEIGYPSLDGCNMYPWDETRRESVDLEEQELCYRAFVAAWEDEPALEGIYFWNWYGPGGILDGDYSPRGKPAARIIQRWYRHRRTAKR
ncbi:MAG: hypothetical protein JXR83_07655 [Deltaproteobacteria bacterium]|nr:hypothetical protein [Deltaproteobacteria bacterium]